MDRRRLLSLLATAGCGLATGCDDGGAEVASWRENMRLNMSGVRNDFDKLKSTVEDFDTRDWRDVVSDLKANVSDLLRIT